MFSTLRLSEMIFLFITV